MDENQIIACLCKFHSRAGIISAQKASTVYLAGVYSKYYMTNLKQYSVLPRLGLPCIFGTTWLLL
jgi:hypothetical protein